MRLSAFILAFTLLLCATVFPVCAAGLTDTEYSALFHRAQKGEAELSELESVFLSDPLHFVSALAKEDYGTMYGVALHMGGADWANDPDRTAHRNALLHVSGADNLTQSQRRVVKWLLVYTDISSDYDIFAGGIDYSELFSRVPECDGSLSYQILPELLAAFDRGCFFFLEVLAQENVIIRSATISLLAEEHYYNDYNTHGTIGETMTLMAQSENLPAAQQQLITNFWGIVQDLESLPPPAPPSSTSTVPSQSEKLLLVADRQTIHLYESVHFQLLNEDQGSFRLRICRPDGTTHTSRIIGNTVHISFDEVGEYTVFAETDRIGGAAVSDPVRISVMPRATSTRPTTRPATPPQEETPPDDGGNALWIILGVIAVALGAQAVAMVAYKRKQNTAD